MGFPLPARVFPAPPGSGLFNNSMESSRSFSPPQTKADICFFFQFLFLPPDLILPRLSADRERYVERSGIESRVSYSTGNRHAPPKVLFAL